MSPAIPTQPMLIIVRSIFFHEAVYSPRFMKSQKKAGNPKLNQLPKIELCNLVSYE